MTFLKNVKTSSVARQNGRAAEKRAGRPEKGQGEPPF